MMPRSDTIGKEMAGNMVLKGAGQFFRHLVSGIMKHNIGAYAAVMAFFGFSAMIPLALLLVYGASLFFVQHGVILNFLLNVVESYVPTLPQGKLYLTENITHLALMNDRIGIIGGVGLLWTTLGGFVSLQRILDAIWEVREPRSFLKQYLVGFIMLGVLLFLTLLSSLTSTLSLTHSLGRVGLKAVFLRLDFFQTASYVLFPLLLFLTCYFCFRILPSHQLKNSCLVTGSLISTLGIYLSREAFVWYTGHLGVYEMIYGSLTFIMLFTLWAYIVSIIVLLGAEAAVALNAVLGSGQSGPERTGPEKAR
ncbi:Virulence factor BrkB [Acididesulfobacillus acetoxydans]|uniref:Virulence factor BrkB n=1 Tax=Acididesulfobacillus acetoxydans TaxID=1561005 RepID=A0A8S0X630_9FIRM|nr:YihY/virulence factor BrkB family protein [Acididesulfobacillus acetoxydans]CAA7602160.1 Virulence factor BrkB [Acididesulfobacillus acetoxydans]CEJ08716.1 Virulence factor BrkB [Acididesulfobacillus acetoxydans]